MFIACKLFNVIIPCDGAITIVVVHQGILLYMLPPKEVIFIILKGPIPDFFLFTTF